VGVGEYNKNSQPQENTMLRNVSYDLGIGRIPFTMTATEYKKEIWTLDCQTSQQVYVFFVEISEV